MDKLLVLLTSIFFGLVIYIAKLDGAVMGVKNWHFWAIVACLAGIIICSMAVVARISKND